MKNSDFDKLFNAAKKGDEKELESLGNAAAANLTESQKQDIEKAMSDPAYLKRILESPAAQELFKKLQGGNK